MPLNQILSEMRLSSGQSPTATTDNLSLILRSLRTHLGMDVAFASKITSSEVIIRYADTGRFAPVKAGDTFPVGGSYCKRIIDGRIPYLIHDASSVPEVAQLACTLEMPIGAHISVPLRLSDGSVYGTFCCFSRGSDHSLTARDVQMMHAFADLAAAQIEGELMATQGKEQIISRTSEIVERAGPTMVFQPIYGLESGEIIGVEALARFPDSETRGPDAWFSEAAEVGLGIDLELAAIRSALRALPHLPADIYLAVNISPETIVSGKLAPVLDDSPPGRLVLEITEHAMVNDFVLLRDTLEPLRSHLLVAVDDAGAGYAGLRHILDISPDIIKLDMSLTRGIDKDPARAALASALIGFAVNIDSRIVAEGIETEAELATLRQLGTDAAQGYFLQRPQPLQSLTRFLIARRLGKSSREAARAPGSDGIPPGTRSSHEHPAPPAAAVSRGSR